jgi:predicted acylesterase/phospholipase RssA
MLSTSELTASPHTKDSVFCLVPLDDDVRHEWLRDDLLNQFRQWGTVAVLEGPDPSADFGDEEEAAAARRLGELEDQFDHVLIESAPASHHHPWARFCVRQADRDIIVAGRNGPAGDLEIPGLRGCELVFSDAACDPATRRRWIDALEPRAHYHVGDPSKVGALARRLTGRSVGIVLSGGGARGLAHIGVLRALEESGIAIDRVGGTSMGAFVGAMFASGFPAEEIVRLFHRELVDRKPFNDYTIPVVSLARGKRARGMMDRLFGEKAIEDLPLDFFCITADLVRGEEIVHRIGPVWNLVGASMSIPGWAPPSRIGEQVLVDGGILNNFPVDVMASAGEGPIVGVDAMGMGRKAPASSSAETAARRPNIGETLAGAVTLGSRRRAEENAGQAALVIRPEVGEAGLLEFTQLDRLYELGRRCALEALEAGGPGVASLVPA